MNTELLKAYRARLESLRADYRANVRTIAGGAA